jgi:hypothetical protein
MSFLTRPVEDVLELMLNRLHGGFLQTPLNSEHLAVDLRQGIYTLSDLEVSPKTVNAQLKDSPVHITSGLVKLAQLQLPSFYRILDDAVVIIVQDAEVNLCSAALSGYSVNQGIKGRSAEKLDDNMGVNMVTNFIGSILSNIQISVTRLTVNIRADPGSEPCLRIHFAKVTYKTVKGSEEQIKKKLKFEGVAVSFEEGGSEVFADYYTLFSLPSALSIKIGFTREQLSAAMIYTPPLQFLITKDQLLSVLGILTKLKPTSLVEEESEGLQLSQFQEELNENLRPKLKNRKVKFHFEITCISVIIGLEPSTPFMKIGSDYEPNKNFKGSHLELKVNFIILEKVEAFSVKAFGLSVSSHILVNSPGTSDSSSMFYSANSMISSDFFRSSKSTLKWELDRSKQHFCSSYLFQAKGHRGEHAELPISKYAFTLEGTSSKAKLNFSIIEVCLTEAVLARLLDLKLPKASPPVASAPTSHPQGSSKKLMVYVPVLTATYEQSEGSCSCEGHKRALKFSCSSLRVAKTHELSCRAFDNALRTVDHEGTSQVLAAITSWRVSLAQSEQFSEIREESDSSSAHQEHEHGQGYIPFPAKCVYDDRGFPSQDPERLRHEYDCWKPSADKLEIERAKTLHVHLEDLHVNMDQSTLLSLQQYRFPKPESDGSQGEVLVVKFKVVVFSLSLLGTLPFLSQLHSASQGILRTQVSVLDATSTERRQDDARLDLFRLVLRSISGSFFKLQVGFLTSVEVSAAELMSVSKISRLIETDRHTVFLRLTFSKTHRQDLDITLQNSFLHLADIKPLIEYAKLIKFKSTPPNDQDVFAIHLLASNVTVSFSQPTMTFACIVDQVEVWVGLINNSSSQAVRVELKTCQLDLAQGHAEVGASGRSEGFTQVLCIESVEVALSLSNHLVECQGDVRESHILDCEIGSCEPIAPCLYTSVTEAPQSQEKRVTLHVNIGPIFGHCCKDTLQLLAAFSATYKRDPAEEAKGEGRDTELKQSQGVLEEGRAGMVFEPSCPDQFSSFNLLDCVPAMQPQPPPSPPVVADSPRSRIVHCHPEFPASFLGLNQAVHCLRAGQGQPLLKLSLSLSYISFSLYEGCDLHNALNIRRSPNCIQVKVKQTGVSYCKFLTNDQSLYMDRARDTERTQDLRSRWRSVHYDWRLACSIDDVEVRDFIKHSSVNKLLHSLQSIALLSLEVSSVFPNPLFSPQTELVASCRVLPVKLNIDQYFIKFLLGFSNAPQSAPPKPQAPPEVPHPPQSPKPFYLQRLEITATELSINYIPHSTAMEGLPFAANALSVLPVETIHLSFPRTVIRGASRLDEIVNHIKDLYVAHIKANEVGEILCKLTPFNSLYNFAEAAYTLAVSPYQVGLFGVKSALISFIRVGSLESLRVCTGFFNGTYGLVQAVGGIAGLSLPSRQDFFKPLLEAQEALGGRH